MYNTNKQCGGTLRFSINKVIWTLMLTALKSMFFANFPLNQTANCNYWISERTLCCARSGHEASVMMEQLKWKERAWKQFFESWKLPWMNLDKRRMKFESLSFEVWKLIQRPSGPVALITGNEPLYLQSSGANSTWSEYSQMLWYGWCPTLMYYSYQRNLNESQS